jgi:ATP-binding cassette, subfamily B (MDR/TAP), member 1
LNGVDLKDLNVSWLHDQIGLVSQEPRLFDASVSENVRFGCPNATQEEIEDACRKANIHESIMEWPDQYKTNLASGLSISGGQVSDQVPIIIYLLYLWCGGLTQLNYRLP